ncbi:hypothetical protein RI054_06g32730 [Pseudoscourfieldia marina]
MLSADSRSLRYRTTYGSSEMVGNKEELADPTNLPLQRVPIPPDVMKSVLHCGLAAAAQPSLDLQLLRDCACLVTSYLFFNRSDTAFQLQRCGPDAMLPDLRIDEERQQLNFVERNFKGKSKKLTKRLLTIDCADKLDCLQLLRAFTRATSHLRCQYFWQLPSDTAAGSPLLLMTCFAGAEASRPTTPTTTWMQMDFAFLAGRCCLCGVCRLQGFPQALLIWWLGSRFRRYARCIHRPLVALYRCALLLWMATRCCR